MTKRLATLALILVVSAVFMKVYPFQARVPLRRSFATFPLDWQGWQGRRAFFTDDIERNLGVQEYMQRFYEKENRVVDLYVGYYGAQKAGEQIHSPKHCLPGGGLEAVSETVLERDVPGYGRVRFMEAVYQRAGEQQIFYYWYRMMDEHITNGYWLKLKMVWNSLVHRRNEATFVRLSAAVPGGEKAAAEAVLQGFMNDFLPLLKEYLPE